MTTLTNEPTMKIRALERTDLKNIHIINNKAETMRLWFEEPYESLDELTSLYDKHIHDNTERRFVIEANDTFIGIVELMSIDYIHRTCEIQIIIISGFSGKEFDWAEIKGSIRDALGKFLYEQTKRKPVILPVVMEARQPQDLNKRYTKKNHNKK